LLSYLSFATRSALFASVKTGRWDWVMIKYEWTWKGILGVAKPVGEQFFWLDWGAKGQGQTSQFFLLSITHWLNVTLSYECFNNSTNDEDEILKFFILLTINTLLPSNAFEFSINLNTNEQNKSLNNIGLILTNNGLLSWLDPASHVDK